MSGQQAKRRLDPGVALIAIGGAILLLAIWWLLATPDPHQAQREACEAQPGQRFVLSGTRGRGEGVCVLEGKGL